MIENEEVIDFTVSSEEEDDDDDDEEINGDFERGESIDDESVIDLSFLSDDDDIIEPSINSNESSSEMTLRFSPLKPLEIQLLQISMILTLRVMLLMQKFLKIAYFNFVCMLNI